MKVRSYYFASISQEMFVKYTTRLFTEKFADFVSAGKLKDMGNSILGRFGMNVDNFKAVKDPNTGSYSISFQQ